MWSCALCCKHLDNPQSRSTVVAHLITTSVTYFSRYPARIKYLQDAAGMIHPNPGKEWSSFSYILQCIRSPEMANSSNHCRVCSRMQAWIDTRLCLMQATLGLYVLPDPGVGVFSGDESTTLCPWVMYIADVCICCCLVYSFDLAVRWKKARRLTLTTARPVLFAASALRPTAVTTICPSWVRCIGYVERRVMIAAQSECRSMTSPRPQMSM